MENGQMKTQPFKMGRFRCYWLMLLHQAPAVGWIMLAAIAALTTAGFIVSPWAGLATIGFDIFIVVMGMSFVIMAYGFHSITGVNLSEHTLAIEGDKIKVEFNETSAETGEDSERDTAPASRPVEILLKDLRPYSVYPGGVLIPVEGPRKGFLWLPLRAFASDTDFQTFLKSLYSRIG